MVLEGVVAFVDCAGDEGFGSNQTKLKKLLKELGAAVAKSRGDSKITHVVWKNGSQTDAERRMGKIYVTPAWVRKCKEAKRRLEEEEFEPEEYAADGALGEMDRVNPRKGASSRRVVITKLDSWAPASICRTPG